VAFKMRIRLPCLNLPILETRFLMKVYPLCFAVVFSIATLPVARLAGQVTTNVPSPVQGAEPVTVEHIKIHGEALEGNLEGDAIDRDVIVFLPPSYKTKKRHLRFRKASVHRWPAEVCAPTILLRSVA
jgi:hypothetical protein